MQKATKTLLMQLHISKKFYTNLIQNEQSNIIIYIIFYFFFPFGMKNLIYNLPRLSFSKSLQINVFQCSGNHNCILSVTKKIKKGEVLSDKIFHRESNSTITIVRLSISPSVHHQNPQPLGLNHSTLPPSKLTLFLE